MKKVLIIIGLAIMALLAAHTFRVLWEGGSFKKINPHFDGSTTVVTGMAGAEDITVDPATGMALVSSFDRWKKLAGGEVKGAIYAFDFRASPPVFTELTAGFDQPDFSPHGLSLYEDPVDRTKWLFVVNHRDAGHFVEIFQWTDTALVHTETIESTHFVSPNDVVGVGKREFYFTNDHGSSGGVSHFKDFLLIGTGQVGYFDGEKTEILDTGIRYANGINISQGGKYLFVAACTGGKILVYDRQPFKKSGEIDCGTGVDNIEVDGAGNLWVGAHPKLLAFLSHSKSAQKRSPSQVLKIEFTAPSHPAHITEVYLNDGDPLSGSSVAAVYQNYLLMGTVFEDGILIGKMDGFE